MENALRAPQPLPNRSPTALHSPDCAHKRFFFQSAGHACATALHTALRLRLLQAQASAAPPPPPSPCGARDVAWAQPVGCHRFAPAFLVRIAVETERTALVPKGKPLPRRGQASALGIQGPELRHVPQCRTLATAVCSADCCGRRRGCPTFVPEHHKRNCRSPPPPRAPPPPSPRTTEQHRGPLAGPDQRCSPQAGLGEGTPGGARGGPRRLVTGLARGTAAVNCQNAGGARDGPLPGISAVLKKPDFFFLLTAAQGPPTANRQPPPTANRQPLK